MPTFFDLVIAYNLEIEWLLTWFPITSSAPLKEVRMRGGTLRHVNTGPEAIRASGALHSLGQGLAGDGDVLAVNRLVSANINIFLTPDKVFQSELSVSIGRSSRRKFLVLRPDTRTPVMLTMHAAGDDPAIEDTVVALQVVFTASNRLGFSDVVTQVVLGP